MGEKIKRLRKELTLTQSQLAGDEMSKSMLSQIENNVAKPSMKTLKYIASKLNKPISYFLNDENIENSKPIELPIELINMKLKNIDEFLKNINGEKAKEETEKLLEEYNFNKNSKIYADVIYRLGGSLNLLNKFDEAEDLINKSIKIYLDNNLYINAAKTYLELIDRHWDVFDYEKCLKLTKEANEIYNKSSTKDTFFEIELLYMKSIMYSTLADFKKTLSVLQEAITLSNDEKTYYKIDEIYKIYALINFKEGDYESFKYNLNKAKQYAEFTENKKTLSIIEYNLAEYENEMFNPYSALEHLERCSTEYNRKDHWVQIEKARSFYLLKEYDTALKIIKKADYPSRYKHRLDYLNIWKGKIYEGLILNKLGNSSEAIESINEGIKKMEFFSDSKELAFAYKSLSEVYGEMKNYKEAYIFLQKAVNIEDSLKFLRLKSSN
ncbi:helix-turn-helix domain-containing protein [Oceanirhabdus seepicola]|uniref:Helix-turn-helix transcriptional regulator n=1 Tax=Oceanirhabdus seepicola TaxID=2828781 RepID=A0A9J6NXL1_9CLOT|nr:helix-turn-helix transcriptional regulator [Oceanirhabdus seepicola]MCM1988365.1 helix-turn-helix transcriptional regulator [Oceanirhabdus seepicola]